MVADSFCGVNRGGDRHPQPPYSQLAVVALPGGRPGGKCSAWRLAWSSEQYGRHWTGSRGSGRPLLPARDGNGRFEAACGGRCMGRAGATGTGDGRDRNCRRIPGGRLRPVAPLAGRIAGRCDRAGARVPKARLSPAPHHHPGQCGGIEDALCAGDRNRHYIFIFCKVADQTGRDMNQLRIGGRLHESGTQLSAVGTSQ